MNDDSTPPGQLLSSRYRLIRQVGSGGMAKVYLAQDQRLERLVAVKLIHAHLSEDPAFAARFQREAVMAAKLNHPNLVNVFDQGVDDDQPYLVMEYVPGRTLREVLREFGSLTPKQMLNLMQQILAGLAAAHAAGIVHRDIKPENVLLADDGRVKLSDFGLARPIANQTESDSVFGTAAYIAPEILSRGQADARSDVYSAGILMFELLTGKQPFTGEVSAHVAAQHAANSVPRPSLYRSDVPESIDDLVLFATERDPSLRPSNAAELLDAVIQAKQGGSQTSNRTERLNEANTSATTVLAPGKSTEVLGNHTEVFSENPEEPKLAIEKHQPRRVFAKWISLSVIFALIGGGVGWWFGAGPGALRAVPNFEGRSLELASNQLKQLGFTVAIQKENSSTVAPGNVIDTAPTQGTLVLPGNTVTVKVSLGPKLLQVPNLKGKDVAAATQAILGAGFTFGGAEAWFDSLPVGQVFDYLGSDGTKQVYGSAITLKISLGPLPSVANIPQQTAVDLLTSAGLKVNKIDQE
ncbi:MAG: hypothetical protein RLZZ400_745, partial [Actinomycetota bacterium]